MLANRRGQVCRALPSEAPRMITPKEKQNRTQWASQFLAAAELVRRNCVVSFTMGNTTPIADLMVGLRDGRQFWVDVKGLSFNTAWPLSPKRTMSELYYILVRVGEDRRQDRFFILTQSEANQLVARYIETHPTNSRKWSGFDWKDALAFENQWHVLPRCADAAEAITIEETRAS